MNNEEKLSLLQLFFDDINDTIRDEKLDDDEALEEIEYICRHYKIKLHNHSVLQTLVTVKESKESDIK